MKKQRLIALLVVFLMCIITIYGCSAQKGDVPAETTSEDINKEVSSATTNAVENIEEGKDTNNGRPYNLTPIKYDSRDDRYLNGINATRLPVTDEPVTLVIWESFNSTVMQGLEESEVYKELEKRTGVKTEFIYPPVGQETDNFNLRVASNDLPHIFVRPPGYAGGYHKAVEDGVYIELTPYYDKGLMPNIKWIRENNEDINRDIVDDEGRMYYFPMLDIVPTDPWSGLWVRADWCEELGLELPETIDDWDKMLRAMKEAKGIAPLAMNMGFINNNYAFVSAYDTGHGWINKAGKAVYGPIEPGYKDFLSKINEWYEEGLIDPDFATRDGDSYNANIANGKVGSCTLNYGELGQAKLSGQLNDPNFSLKPVVNPISYDGQIIHLRQDNATVRSSRNYFTTRLVDDGLDEIAVAWQDYWYSQDGGDLCSYGPEGISYVWNEDGEYEWIYPALNNDEGLDFWTIFPRFKLHEGSYLRNSAAYEFEPEVFESIEVWGSQDASWVMPENRSYTAEEQKELANIMTDINTYRDEMVLKFIMGQEHLDNFDDFAAAIKSMNIDRAIEIETAVIERYLNR